MSKSKSLILIFLAIVSMICAPTLAAEKPTAEKPASILEQAGKLYGKGAFKEALKKYNEVADMGLESGELYYNMGNAYFKLGEKGEAILYYRRAQKILPRDNELIENLEFARTFVRDKSTPQILETDTWLTELPHKISAGELLKFAAVVFCASILFFCGAVYFDSRKAINFTKRVGLALLGIWFLATSFLGYIEYRQRTAPGGVILSPRTEVRAGPGDSYSPVFILHEGSETTIQKTEGDWYKISYPSVGSGWVNKSDIEKI